MLFDNILYRRIQGRCHLAAVFGVKIVLIVGEEHIASVFGFQPYNASVFSLEIVVVEVLDSLKAVSVAACEPYNMAGKVFVRVIALACGFKMDAHNIIFLFKLTDFISHLAGLGRGNSLIPVFCVLGLVNYALLVNIKQL